MANPLSKPNGEEPLEDGYLQYGRGAGLRKLVFRALDKSNQEVKKIATIDPHRRKIILIQPSETSLYESALREKGISGYLYIVAHASPTSIQGISISAISRLAALIGRSHIWNGEPILIDACNAGAQADGIASKLAATLSTYVTAPTRWTWTYPMGGSAVGQGAYDKLPGILSGLPIPNLLRPGTWRTWGPDGAMTGDTRTSPRDTGASLSPAAARALAAKPTGS